MPDASARFSVGRRLSHDRRRDRADNIGSAEEMDRTLGFELRIAAMRDPHDGRSATDPTIGIATTILLNGKLDCAASGDVLRVTNELFDRGAESIIVDMERVDIDDAASMSMLTEGLMATRSAGRHVQVRVRDAALHATMAAMPNARDWLLADPAANIENARRAIHLDGPSKHGAEAPRPPAS